MGKFKVGDRVRYSGKYVGYSVPEHVGKFGTVQNDDSTSTTIVKWDDEDKHPAFSVFRDNIELIDDRASAGGGFKVGDKIRLIAGAISGVRTIGDVYEATARSSSSVETSVSYRDADGRVTWAPGTYFELVQTLTIEAGKFYRTRDGQKVGPLTASGSGDYPWIANGLSYNENGLWITNSEDDADLIAEWIDDPAVALPASNDNTQSTFKLGDRVRIVKNTREEYLTKHIGNEFVVTSLEGSDGSKVAGETLPYWYPASEIELVTPTAPSTPAIVALIENGTAKPATRPKVHADQARAATEAERLALQFPGQQFGVFVLATSKIADVVNVPTAVLRAA